MLHSVTMRRLGAFMLALMMPLALHAQQVINGFEYMAEDTTNFEYVWSGQGFSEKPYMNLSDYTTDPVQGETALEVDWQIYTPESWGGFMQIVRQIPDSVGGFFDLSDFTHITFAYNNLEGPTLTNGDPTTSVESRLLLFDSSDGGREEDTREVWYSQTSQILSSAPGWNRFELPLEYPETGPLGAPVPDEGFTLPGWAGAGGNGELDLDQITGYAIEWTSTSLGGDSTASGLILLDDMKPMGVRYNMMESFDAFAERTDVETSQSGAGSIGLTTLTDNPWEGDGTLQVDYTVDANQSYGGHANFFVNLPEGEFFDDMSERTHVSLFYNVVEPPSIPEGYVLRFKLHDTSEGQVENWYFETDAVLDTTAGWHRLKMPLKQLAGDPTDQGFSIATWEQFRGNETLDLDQISGFSVDFVGLAEASGTQSSGTILFDRLTGYGFQSSDTEPPAIVEGLNAVTGEYSNIVTWEDVPGETAETYDVYYSFDPITSLADLERGNVESAASSVARGTQVVTHPIFAPVDDQEVTYYYAITATDEWGNTSEVSTLSEPITNTAKGKVTISLTDIGASFAADGELTEWAGVTPIHLAPSIGSKIVSNTAVDGDQDLSADVYLVMDEEAIYVAFDITDDFYEPTGAANPWENDGAELYIGLYDAHGLPHQSFARGEEPDYKFNLYSGALTLDTGGSPFSYAPGDANYSITERFPSGYIIEAKLPYEAFKFEEDVIFTPTNGMRIPLDIVLQDQDEGTREGIMVYSRDNDDNSYVSPSNWAYTWIGDSFDTGTDVADDGAAPLSFELGGNYPNPFSGRTEFRYTLDTPAPVKISVYNVLGQRVAQLAEGETQSAGEHTAEFDASELASGVYVLQLQAGEQMATRMMVVRK